MRSAARSRIEVELEAGGQRLGAFAELAPEGGIFGNAALPGGEGRFPGIVRREEAGKVPRVGGIDFAAGRELFDIGHGELKSYCNVTSPV